VTILTIFGNVPAAERALEATRLSIRSLLLDLSEATETDPMSIIRLVAKAYNLVASGGGELKLVVCSEPIRHALASTKIGSHFTTHSALPDALRSFAARGFSPKPKPPNGLGPGF
jgi:anti-anti-sigma regulatory factor